MTIHKMCAAIGLLLLVQASCQMMSQQAAAGDSQLLNEQLQSNAVSSQATYSNIDTMAKNVTNRVNERNLQKLTAQMTVSDSRLDARPKIDSRIGPGNVLIRPTSKPWKRVPTSTTNPTTSTMTLPPPTTSAPPTTAVSTTAPAPTTTNASTTAPAMQKAETSQNLQQAPVVQPHGYKANRAAFATNYGSSAAVNYYSYNGQSAGVVNTHFSPVQPKHYSAYQYENYAAPAAGVNSGCQDRHQWCKAWGQTNQCQKSPVYMNAMCKSTCKCNKAPTPKPSTTCIDRRPSCKGWAKMKQCQQNPKYMKKNCPKSCNCCPQAQGAGGYGGGTSYGGSGTSTGGYGGGTGYGGGAGVPVHCQVSQWAQWSKCAAPCGPGYKSRSRQVIQNAQNGGQPCGVLYESAACYSSCGPPPTPPPIECKLGEWGLWGACSSSCGVGTQLRTRQVQVPAFGSARPCPSNIQTKQCEAGPCVVQDCVLGDWSMWTMCSVSCGVGVQRRNRNVVQYPAPAGKPCQELHQTTSCDRGECVQLVDCSWGLWGSWGTCSLTCGGGVSERYREVATPASGGGNPCQGLTLQSSICNTHVCPIAMCTWGEWGSWSVCSATCDVGVRHRLRQPATSNHFQCPGPSQESAPCNTFVPCAQVFKPNGGVIVEPYPVNPYPVVIPYQPKPPTYGPLPRPRGCVAPVLMTRWTACNCLGQQTRFRKRSSSCHKVAPIQRRKCQSPCAKARPPKIKHNKICKPSCYKRNANNCCCTRQCRRRKRQIIKDTL